MRLFETILILTTLLLLSSTALACDLRGPYVAPLAVSYGYDHGSGWGCTDYNCGSICYSGHRGNDFPLAYGTNVVASAAGTVTATSNSCNDYGWARIFLATPGYPDGPLAYLQASVASQDLRCLSPGRPSLVSFPSQL